MSELSPIACDVCDLNACDDDCDELDGCGGAPDGRFEFDGCCGAPGGRCEFDGCGGAPGGGFRQRRLSI